MRPAMPHALRFVAVLACALIGLVAPERSAAYRVSVEYRLFRNWNGIISATSCGLELSGPNLVSRTGLGIGVAGSGPEDEMIDGGESVRMRFELPVRNLAYWVSAASNGDGDGLVGEHFVEALVDDVSLGVVAVHGTGLKDMAALFGKAAIDELAITAGADGIRIRTVSYDLAPDQSIRVPIVQVANAEPTELTYCGLTFTSSSGVLGLDGALGVFGGAGDYWIDPGEVLSVELDEPVTQIRYQVNGHDSNGNSKAGEHFVEAFDELGDSLGFRSATSGAEVDLEALFGGVAIGRFELTGADQVQLALVRLVPEPAGAGGAALAALVACAARRRRRERR